MAIVEQIRAQTSDICPTNILSGLAVNISLGNGCEVVVRRVVKVQCKIIKS